MKNGKELVDRLMERKNDFLFYNAMRKGVMERWGGTG